MLYVLSQWRNQTRASQGIAQWRNQTRASQGIARASSYTALPSALRPN